MSAWQFSALVQGWVDANTPAQPGALSGPEADELWEWLQSKGPVH